MSVDPTADLYKAIGDALAADAEFAVIVGDRVFAGWAAKASLPLVRMSVPRISRYDDDRGDGAEADISIHVYTNNGPVERSTIAERVREVLHDNRLPLDNAGVRYMDHDQTVNIDNPDPNDPNVTSAVVRFTAVIIVEA